jgi:hypothetical protein
VAANPADRPIEPTASFFIAPLLATRTFARSIRCSHSLHLAAWAAALMKPTIG